MRLTLAGPIDSRPGSIDHPAGDAGTVPGYSRGSNAMLAYRHAFHAGNHADVLKHTTLALVLRYMNQKDKAYRLVDTHAGAGGYSLQGRFAQKKGEFEQGIARLWDRDDLPPAVADYVALVRQFNPEGGLKQYPGSPAFAQMLLRRKDQLRMFELHPTDHRILQSYIGEIKGAEVYDTDGFDGLKGQIPPSTKRGVVLMDPSYEGHADYSRVISTLRDALTRFVDGVYVVWYPQVSKLEAAQLPKRLEAVAPKGWLHARLTVQQPDQQGFGLAGSGMFIINPPYTLHDELLAVLPYLTEVLGQYDGANYLLEQRVG
jgi:23S rRNA (adenine2030-N6)-methyltransferase